MSANDSPRQSAPAGSALTAAARQTQSLAELRPIFELDQIVAKVFEEMGLGTVFASTEVDDHPPKVDFSVLHFVILPQRSAWLDFMLETDRASAMKIFETFSGSSDAADSDLADVLRETMNLIHGSMKVAFKAAGVDVIIPLVPQSVATDSLSSCPGGVSLQSRHVFAIGAITLRLTLIARVSPITHKQLKNFRLAEVLVDPISPDGDDQLVIVKKHTMLNKRLLAKVRDMADYEGDDARTHAVIEPSPLASLIPHD